MTLPYGLTPREYEVLLLTAEGLTSKEIAHRLGIAPNTVRAHQQTARCKTDSASMPQATAKIATARVG